jgi:hypothetical protein
VDSTRCFFPLKHKLSDKGERKGSKGKKRISSANAKWTQCQVNFGLWMDDDTSSLHPVAQKGFEVVE